MLSYGGAAETVAYGSAASRLGTKVGTNSGYKRPPPKRNRELRSLMKRFARGTDANSRTFQERIARRIVEKAAEGVEPFLSIYLARFDPVVRKSAVHVDDQRTPGELPVIPRDEERDAAVALILKDLQKTDEESGGDKRHSLTGSNGL
jgi:hypothetical protein